MARICVNVFNLTKLNSILSFAKIGVYHTSVLIDDMYEYYYGFADFGYTGIDSPEVVNELPSVMRGTFHSRHEMGMSVFTRRECRYLIGILRKSKYWLSDNYNILFHNCNKFSLFVCKLLLGERNLLGYPYWVERGAAVARFMYKISASQYICFRKGLKGLAHPASDSELDGVPLVPEDVGKFPDELYALTPQVPEPPKIMSVPDFVSFDFTRTVSQLPNMILAGNTRISKPEPPTPQHHKHKHKHKKQPSASGEKTDSGVFKYQPKDDIKYVYVGPGGELVGSVVFLYDSYDNNAKYPSI